MGFLHRGRRERPLTRAERRQLTVPAVATLAGLVIAVAGAVLLVPRNDPLGPLLMLTGTVIVSAAGFSPCGVCSRCGSGGSTLP